jgi:hypothetical protein
MKSVEMNSSEQPKSLRYAVLWHSQTDEPHFDLLIETYPGSDLATWRSPVWPIERRVELRRLRDHRRIFLDYEGQLTGDRGQVRRVAGGECRVSIGEAGSCQVQFSAGGGLMIRPVAGDIWEAQAC